MRADRRREYHPPPATPQQIATTVETITDTPMLMANLLPNDTLNVVRQAEEVLDQITSERFLKLALIQIATRIDASMSLEKQTHTRQRDVHHDMKNLIDGADKLMKLEILQGRFNLKPATPENAMDPSDEAAHLRQFDVVDRNLIRSATMKVINMIRRETNHQYEATGLVENTSREAGTDHGGDPQRDGTEPHRLRNA